MIGLSGLGFGGGLPLLGGQNNQNSGAPPQAGGSAENPPAETGGSSAGTNNGGDAGSTNDTAPTQTVAAPNGASTSAATANATKAEANSANAGNRVDLDAQVEGGERALAEKAVTKLFFDSLLSSVSSTPNVADVGIAEKADDVDDSEVKPQAATEATVARERFEEGLKLVNRPV